MIQFAKKRVNEWWMAAPLDLAKRNRERDQMRDEYMRSLSWRGHLRLMLEQIAAGIILVVVFALVMLFFGWLESIAL